MLQNKHIENNYVARETLFPELRLPEQELILPHRYGHATVGPYFMDQQKSIPVYQLVPIVIMTAALTFLISNHYLNKETAGFVKVDDQFSPGTSSEKTLRYFRDSITLAGENDDGKFVLDVDLNRKEIEKEKFVHYYFANFFQDGKTKSSQTNFYSNTGAIKANAFLPTFENKMFDDLSTRESYAFSFSIDGKKMSVNLTGLEGDFITKNTLAYTRYLSVGTGQLSIDEEKLMVNAALEKAYSSDHSVYLYFPGMEKLQSRTYRFLLWDEEDNFYLLDDSIVSEYNPYYRQHTWILYKNAAQKYTQKFFSGEIIFRGNKKEKNWAVKIPGIETELILSTTDNTEAIWSSGTIGGVARTKTGDKKLFGHFSYKKE